MSITINKMNNVSKNKDGTDGKNRILFEGAATRFSLNWAGDDQAFLVVSLRSSADAAQAAKDSYALIAETLKEYCLEIVHERIFGSLSVEPFVMAARCSALRSYGVVPDNPVTYLQGDPPWGEGFAGAIIHAVAPISADDVWTIQDNGVPCGRAWRKNTATYLMLQNIQAQSGSMTTQVRSMLDRTERILGEHGASYRDVARTWFYLSDILDWYASFNKVRNEKYGEFGIMPGPGDRDILLPASTGIRAYLPSGAAAAMDLLALVPEAGRPSVRRLTNTAQLDAFRYGAAFSRGAVIKEDDLRIIQISGTAAIDEHGISLYPGDIRSQIKCTFDRIQTLLDQEGAELRDIAAATVYVKRAEYADIFREIAVERGLADFPAVCVVADVCREELLFEIDAEAVVGKGSI